MFNPAFVKPLIGITASFCSSRLVGQVIRANVTPVTTFQKVQVAVGAFAIGSAIGNAASEAVLGDVDKAQAFIEGVKEAQQKHRQEQSS